LILSERKEKTTENQRKAEKSREHRKKSANAFAGKLAGGRRGGARDTEAPAAPEAGFARVRQKLLGAFAKGRPALLGRRGRVRRRGRRFGGRQRRFSLRGRPPRTPPKWGLGPAACWGPKAAGGAPAPHNTGAPRKASRVWDRNDAAAHGPGARANSPKSLQKGPKPASRGLSRPQKSKGKRGAPGPGRGVRAGPVFFAQRIGPAGRAKRQGFQLAGRHRAGLPLRGLPAYPPAAPLSGWTVATAS
jgi:hypothetical protein